MTVGVFGFSIVRIVLPVMQARGNLRSLILVMVSATLSDIVLNIWLTPHWGAAGAAAASTVSYLVATIFCLVLIKHYGIWPLTNMNLGRMASLLIRLEPLLLRIESGSLPL